MHYATIKQFDVANGPGIRVSLFVSGCNHKCKGCFNQEAWDFEYGSPFTQETIETILTYLEPDYIAGFTLLGGEPLEPSNQEALLPLLKLIKNKFPSKTIWCYTGYDYVLDELNKELLSYIDILVDGKFVEELKNLQLKFKGSSNQRMIHVQESLNSGKLILWESK